jgi:hypothetical protein
VGATCNNRVWDANECGVDCGGTSGCSACTTVIASKTCGGTNGGGDYCRNPNQKCAATEGDCDSDAECAPGLICRPNTGAAFGLGTTTDVCLPPSCFNGVVDAGEAQVDCGGTSSCRACSGTVAPRIACDRAGTYGVPVSNYVCYRNQTYPEGEWDCDTYTGTLIVGVDPAAGTLTLNDQDNVFEGSLDASYSLLPSTSGFTADLQPNFCATYSGIPTWTNGYTLGIDCQAGTLQLSVSCRNGGGFSYGRYTELLTGQFP